MNSSNHSVVLFKWIMKPINRLLFLLLTDQQALYQQWLSLLFTACGQNFEDCVVYMVCRYTCLCFWVGSKSSWNQLLFKDSCYLIPAPYWQNWPVYSGVCQRAGLCWCSHSCGVQNTMATFRSWCHCQWLLAILTMKPGGVAPPLVW